MKNEVKGTLVLKTGQNLLVMMDADRTFTQKAFTSEWAHAFVGQNGNDYLLQGDNIAYLEVEA